MRVLAIILVLVFSVMAAKSDTTTTVTCDTIVTVKCKTTKVIKALKDTVKVTKVDTVVTESESVVKPPGKPKKAEKKKASNKK